MTADFYPAPVPLGVAQLRRIALELRLRALRGQPNADAVADALDSVIRARHAALARKRHEPERRPL